MSVSVAIDFQLVAGVGYRGKSLRFDFYQRSIIFAVYGDLMYTTFCHAHFLKTGGWLWVPSA
jgi:hypothetical protein